MMLRRYENARVFTVTSTLLGAALVAGGVGHMFGLLPWGPDGDQGRIGLSAGLELLCGLLLFGAAFALGSMRTSGFRGAVGANLLALVCLAVLMLGVAPAMGASVVTLGFHAVMLLLVVLNAVGLWRLRPRNPLKRAQHEIAARLY
jgi:hypothetical protein